MMKRFDLIPLSPVFTDVSIKKDTDKKTLDRQAILNMAGVFRVTFDFAETFSQIKKYQREKLYSSSGIEYVFPIIDEPDYISLQHILVVNKEIIVKHWRQDWLYENKKILVYQKNNTWKNKIIPDNKAKGTWTQKVFQVDDSPRYESYGTWVFTNNKSYWESTTDTPLPRRQSHRDDYNILNRNFRIEIGQEGWMIDQNNRKIHRDENGIDNLIVWEKGFEVFARGNYDVQIAKDYWQDTKKYWAVVRKVFQDLVNGNEVVRFREKVNSKPLYERIFKLEEEFSGGKYDAVKSLYAIENVIKEYMM
ncbi:MAG: hypothetical protein M9887_06285 [Chitinophagales bacterium]|nr:hypothetical protein [Chitinophagales bacterium]